MRGVEAREDAVEAEDPLRDICRSAGLEVHLAPLLGDHREATVTHSIRRSAKHLSLLAHIHCGDALQRHVPHGHSLTRAGLAPTQRTRTTPTTGVRLNVSKHNLFRCFFHSALHRVQRKQSAFPHHFMRIQPLQPHDLLVMVQGASSSGVSIVSMMMPRTKLHPHRGSQGGRCDESVESGHPAGANGLGGSLEAQVHLALGHQGETMLPHRIRRLFRTQHL